MYTYIDTAHNTYIHIYTCIQYIHIYRFIYFLWRVEGFVFFSKVFMTLKVKDDGY